MEKLKNCWEIKACGREKGGDKVRELGECIASKDAMGHSCWVVSGTFCGGEVQGTYAQKKNACMSCEVYIEYHRAIGKNGKEVAKQFPDEETRYNKLLMDKFRKS